MSKWFGVDHNGYLFYLGEHDIGESDAEEFFNKDENFQGDFMMFMDEDTAEDYYLTLKPVFEKEAQK